MKLATWFSAWLFLKGPGKVVYFRLEPVFEVVSEVREMENAKQLCISSQ